jgi:hypothetical protein
LVSGVYGEARGSKKRVSNKRVLQGTRIVDV